MDDELFSGQYTWSSTTPTVAVANAIAGIENVDATELSGALDTKLYDHVNPEALDTLVTDSNHPVVSFTVDDYRVRITGNQLSISPVGEA